MSDLLLNNEGDLEIIELSNSGIESNNIQINKLFDLNTTNNYKKDLIIKAIKTPKGNISLPITTIDSISFKDQSYGSELYKELSEGITLNFLSRVKSHVIASLTNAGIISNIKDVNLAVVNTNTIQLNISYTDNTITNTIILNF